MIDNRLSLDPAHLNPSKGYFKKMKVKKTKFDPEKLYKTPCMLHKPDVKSDALLIYFHANAEDINLSSHLCEYLKRNLKVSLQFDICLSHIWSTIFHSVYSNSSRCMWSLWSTQAMEYISQVKPLKMLYWRMQTNLCNFCSIQSKFQSIELW